MKGFWGPCSLVAAAIMLWMPQALAQSGVISGPPQVRPGPGGPGPQGQRPQGATWIAVVAGFDGSGKRVSVGYSGHQRSKVDAESAAIRACHGSDRTIVCRNPLAVSNGCLYIVAGNKGGGGVRWGRGGTREAAFEECRRGGYVCPDNKLVGGCVPGYR